MYSQAIGTGKGRGANPGARLSAEWRRATPDRRAARNGRVLSVLDTDASAVTRVRSGARRVAGCGKPEAS